MLYTVRDVKAIVESIIGFPLYDLSLIYDGKKLNDSKINICLPVMKPVALKVKKSDTDDQNLGSVGIQQNTNLHFFVQNLLSTRLFIKRASDQKVLQIDAEASDTNHNGGGVKVTKEVIFQELLSSPDDSGIYYAWDFLIRVKYGHLWWNLKDFNYLCSTPVRIPCDKFSLIYSELLKREVKSLYTVRDVKAIVESIVGFPVNEQSLMCDGQQLDDSKVLSSYHIAAESILKIIVKDKIFHITGLRANPLFLEYGGKPLDNFQSLPRYNI
ncbi:polyubiquitin-like [Coffea arabica]|uniref:Polyubiquitin-like n=1 Tax=Coffea arabica TaxID=13443 RepID=A0ABM4W6F3_COFAR